MDQGADDSDDMRYSRGRLENIEGQLEGDVRQVRRGYSLGQDQCRPAGRLRHFPEGPDQDQIRAQVLSCTDLPREGRVSQEQSLARRDDRRGRPLIFPMKMIKFADFLRTVPGGAGNILQFER